MPAAAVLLAAVVAALAMRAQGEARPPGGEAEALVARANAARADAGLPPLRADKRLERAARDYAAAMAATDRFEHSGSDGSTFVGRAEAAGYGAWTYLGENLARAGGAASAENLVDAWLSSESHRANLLSPEASDTGAGCVRKEAATWCVQLFGRRRP
jgi:uncharacterized protein YkwD